jgi:hypothetical protein
MVAAIFVAHPLHVESVAWVSERKDVLSAFFSLLTLLIYVGYARRPTVLRYTGALAALALALMSKPMAVAVPVLMLLLDFWPLRRLTGPGAPGLPRVLFEKLPFLGLAIAVGLVTLSTQTAVGAVATLESSGLINRVQHAIISYALYLRKALWPSGLAAFYPRTPASGTAVAEGVLVLAGITALALRERRRFPHLVSGWLWFLVALAPVIGLIQFGEQAMADRYMYLPLVGLSTAIVWAVSEAFSRLGLSAAAPMAVGMAVVVALAVTARTQTSHWADSVRLWRHTIDVTPPNYRAQENLGTALRERGDLDGALAAYRMHPVGTDVRGGPQQPGPRADAARKDG